jgi:DNA replication protein DnaC
MSLRLVSADDFLPDLDKVRQDEAERRQKYGWDDPIISCLWCGDTGTNPETGLSCSCTVGIVLDRKQVAASQWDTRVPANLRAYTLSGHPNNELARQVAAWIKSGPVENGNNLVIVGHVGTGKTGAAVGALRTIHHTSRPIPLQDVKHPDEIETRNYSVRYWNLVSLLERFREEIGQSQRKALVSGEQLLTPVRPELSNCDALLLDDVAIERPSDWVGERLYSLINDRYTKGLPTIFTSNHRSIAEFEKYLGERMADRVMERCTVIVCDKNWPNLRRKGSK